MCRGVEWLLHYSWQGKGGARGGSMYHAVGRKVQRVTVGLLLERDSGLQEVVLCSSRIVCMV